MAGLPPGFQPFVGMDDATIDAKGRILLSKKKRDRLGDPFVIVLGMRGCLEAYPNAVWLSKWQEITTYDSLNEGREQYTRLLLSFAEDDLRCDGQGRVVVPQRLREMAKLKDKVYVVGAGDRLEIWAHQEWDAFNKAPDKYGAQRRDDLVRAYRQMVGGA